ncbi:amidohydrolase family protein [Gordonia terrae]|uniref:amidohydrolase family protein n=1 Tax=Gordonia terrae TaxID=2055 RepID=UPI003F6C04B4
MESAGKGSLLMTQNIIGGPVVDVHAHCYVDEVDRVIAGVPEASAERAAQLTLFGKQSIEVNAKRFAGEWHTRMTDIDVRLGAMDAMGVDVQAVSVTPLQYHYWAGRELSEVIVRTINESLACTAAHAPDRLVALATVALQFPDCGADQLRHAVTELGMRGVQISSNARGRDFSDRGYDPLWDTAQELGVPIFVHPWGCDYSDRLSSFYLGNIIGQPLETTTALYHMVFGGVLDRFPDLIVCGAHGGGYFPHYLGRADHAFRVRPESRTMARPPSDYLESLYFDSLVYRTDTLEALIAAAGHDRVVLGTDYPYDMAEDAPMERLSVLDTAAARAVAGETAARLLRLTI